MIQRTRQHYAVSYTHLDVYKRQEYTCFDGENGFTQSVCLTNTGVNTSKLNRLEHFIRDFETEGKNMSGEELPKATAKYRFPCVE